MQSSLAILLIFGYNGGGNSLVNLFRCAVPGVGSIEGGFSFALADLAWVQVRPTEGAGSVITHITPPSILGAG